MGTAQAIPTGFVLSDHGALAGLLDDDHTQYALLAGRAGGQTLYGSPTNGEDLTLGGNPGANPGFVNMNSPVIFGPYTGNPAAAYGFDYNPSDSPAGAFIGGGLNFSGTITAASSTFIYESFRGAPVITTNVALGFSAYTVLQALPRLTRSTAGPVLAPLVVNAGPTCEQSGVGVVGTVTNISGVNFSPQLRASGVFASMNATAITGITVAPTHSTVGTSAISYGTIRGVWARNPAVALFQQELGTETMAAYVGLDVDAISFGGNVTKRGVRSSLVAASNTRFLDGLGTAQSDLRGQLNFPVDLVGITFGASSDLSMGWSGGLNALFWQFAAPFDQLLFSNPSSGRFLLDSSVADNEFNFNCNRFSLGAQTGAVGNQVGVFVAPTRTASIGGGWSDFLLTQGGNITVDAALSQLAGWTVNAPSITLGTGSVVDAIGLLVGGNPNQGTNRYGLLVLSNPAGGTLNYCARFQGAAGVRVDGIFEHGNANLGFYGTAPIAQPAAVGVDAASIHAALVSLGLIT